MAHLTPETRRKRRKAFCLIIEIICLVHFAIIVPRDRVFTPENWAHTPAPMRHKLGHVSTVLPALYLFL